MPPEICRVDLQRNKTSLHIVTSVGYSIEYYDARNNKYKVNIKFSVLLEILFGSVSTGTISIGRKMFYEMSLDTNN